MACEISDLIAQGAAHSIVAMRKEIDLGERAMIGPQYICEESPKPMSEVMRQNVDSEVSKISRDVKVVKLW
jgi:hypothetical protein